MAIKKPPIKPVPIQLPIEPLREEFVVGELPPVEPIVAEVPLAGEGIFPSTLTEDGWEYTNIIWSEVGEPIDYIAFAPTGEQYTKTELDIAITQQQDYDLLFKEYQRTGGELDIESWFQIGAPLRPFEDLISSVFPDISSEEFSEYVTTDFDSFMADMSGYTEEKAELLKQLGYSKGEIDSFYGLQPIQVTGAIPEFNAWVVEKGFTPEFLAEDLRARGVAEELIPEMVAFSMSELRAIYEYEHDLGRWGTAMGELDKIFISEPERIPEVALVFGQTLLKLPRQIASAILTATQGQGGASVVDKDWADRFIEEAGEDIAKFQQDIAKQYPNSQLMTELASLSQNLAFSITSMGAGLAVGVPIALTPIPGARVLAYTAGTAASGYMAYQMTTYQIMQQYLELKDAEKRNEFGIGLTQFEEDELKKEFHSLAVKYGLWEAIPEAISNLAFFSILTAPLTSMIGGNIATRIISKIAAMYGQELLTETITQKGQAAIEVYAGLREKDIGWVESFKEIAPQTFLLTTVMAGAGQVIISSKTAIQKARKSLTEEIGVNHPEYQELAENIENNLEEAVKTDPKVEEVVEEVPAVPEVTPRLQEAKDMGISQGEITTEINELIRIDRENLESGAVVGSPISKEEATRQAVRNLIEDKKYGIDIAKTTDILTKERIEAIKTATSFENVFNKSKIPEVVYHGTQSEKIIEFEKREPSGIGIGAVAKAEGEAGFWFMDNQNEARAIGNVIQAKLNVKNPLILEGDIYFNTQGTERLSAISEMEGMGNDGIIFIEPTTKTKWYFVPNKEQIVTKDFYAKPPAVEVVKPPVTIEEEVESEVPPSIEEPIPQSVAKNIPAIAEIGAKEQVRPLRKVLIKINQWRNLFKPIQEAEVLMQEERARFDKKLKEVAGWVGKNVERRARVFEELENPGTVKDLTFGEKRAVTWFNEFFSKWADRLNLPADRRIENYITHIFEEQVKQEENITPEMAAAMEYRTPKKIFNPFTQERLGKTTGLVTDPFLAIQAYESKELKVVYYDALLQKIAVLTADPNMPQSTKNFLNNYTKRMTGDISNIDKAFNITIKEFAEKIRGIPIIGERLYQKLTQGNPAGMAAYNMTGGLYTLFLGFKATSAIRNLSQHTLIIGEVGPTHFLKGMGLRFTTEGKAVMKKSLVLRSRKFAYTAGLDASFIGIMESKFGKAAMKMFRLADWQNVADAFLAGYSEAKSLLPEASEQVWIDRGDEVAARTQYLYTKMNSMALAQNAPGRMLSMLTTWTENWIELTSDWVKRNPSQVYLEQERLTGKKISGANWSTSYKAILIYALIVGLAMAYDDKTRIKLKEYVGVGSLKYLAGTVGGEFPALQTYGSILKVATGFALDDERMLAEGMYEMKAFWPGILKQLDAVSSGEKDWMTLLFYNEGKNFKIKQLKEDWEKGWVDYTDLTDPVIRANKYPTLSQSQAQSKWREENWKEEAQMFVTGRFTTLSTDEARIEVLRLIEKENINPDLVDGYNKIFGADINAELQKFQNRIGSLEKLKIGEEAEYFKTSNYVTEVNRLVEKHGRPAVMSTASPLTKFVLESQDTWGLFEDMTPEGRLLHRQQFPDLEASLYLFGKVSSFKNPKSAEVLLGLMKKYNVPPEAIHAFIEDPSRYDELFTQKFELEQEWFDQTTEYENFGNTEAPNYIEDKEERKLAREKFKDDNPGWVADMRRIEAIDNDASDTIIERWAERGKTIDEFGAGSSQAKVWLIDNPDTHKWALENKLLSDDGSDWNENILRINVQMEGLDPEGDEYKRLNYRKNAYSEDFSEELIDTYVGYYMLPQKPDDYEDINKTDLWLEDDWYLMEHPEFYKEMVGKGIWGERDFSKVPIREVFKKYLEYVKLPEGKRRDDYRWENQDLDAWLVRKFDMVPITEKKRRAELTPTEEFKEDVLEHEAEFDKAMRELEELLKGLR